MCGNIWTSEKLALGEPHVWAQSNKKYSFTARINVPCQKLLCYFLMSEKFAFGGLF